MTLAGADDKLVQQITEQVMAALARHQSGAGSSPQAEVRPPIGICTGDYSKFPELAGRAVGAAASSKAPAAILIQPPASNLQPPIRVLHGIITAKQVEKLDGVIHLAPGARLTPLATDVVKQRKLKIERLSSGTHSHASASVRGTEWVWWIDGRCAIAEGVMTEFRDIAPLSVRRQSTAMADAVREVARRVKDGRAAGAVLFTHAAAAATCFANRCANLRAIVGTSDASIEQAVKQIAANVLIIEYPMHGQRSMRSLVERFTTMARPTLPEIERQLKELSACV